MLYKNEQSQVISLNPLDIQNGAANGLAKLTAEEVQAHLNPEPSAEYLLETQITEAKEYLTATDHKFYIGYVPKEGEDCEAILIKRNEAREFLRANKVEGV